MDVLIVGAGKLIHHLGRSFLARGYAVTLVVREAGAPALYWGDAHGQTRSTVGTGTVEEYYLYARDKALVDIAVSEPDKLDELEKKAEG